MKTKIFFRHVKDSLRSLKRNGWMSVSSISAVAITLS
ncbi:MAG: cell division protein FtsX, partial [Lacticaseibacillus paracasei]|nr:cell division protein FtsX [Lacticaseibacillus paracasei]